MTMIRRLSFLFLFCCLLLSGMSVAVGQTWEVWGTTPVFDDGRIKPMNSFAQQIVKEICGSSQPFLVIDDSVMAELIRAAETRPETDRDPASMPSGATSPFIIEKNESPWDDDTRYDRFPEEDASETDRPIRLSPGEADRIVQRIRALIPETGRYFDANELLLSWVGEPEVWRYIPIFSVPQTDYRDEVLKIPNRNKSRVALRRVSVFQLENSPEFLSRLERIYTQRSREDAPRTTAPFDRITLKLYQAQTTFQTLTFDPRRETPTRMLDILAEACLDERNATTMNACRDAWQLLFDLGGEQRPAAIPGQAADALTAHPTSQRWERINDRMLRILRAFSATEGFDVHRNPNLDVLEREFEKLLDEIDESLEESEAILRRIFPDAVFARRRAAATPESVGGIVELEPGAAEAAQPAAVDVDRLLPRLFSTETRQRNEEFLRYNALYYHHGAEKLRREVEAAYLALYDNGRTLRLLPIISRQVLSGEKNALDVQPWGTAQMVLYSGDDFVRRFFDPQYKGNELSLPATQIAPEILEPLVGEDGTPSSAASEVADGTTEPDGTPVPSPATDGEGRSAAEAFLAGIDGNDEDLSEEQRFFRDLFRERASSDLSPESSGTRVRLGSIDLVRDNFRRLLVDLRTGGRDRISAEFRKSALRFQDSLQTLAGTVDNSRSRLIDSQDDHARWELLDKTRYPGAETMVMEYRYFRWSPLFWMCIFAAISIVLAAASLVVAYVRREMIESTPLPLSGGDDASHGGEEAPGTETAISLPEEGVLWAGIFMLLLSVAVTFLGGLMRAWISGWAPVTNMFETIILMAFSVGLFGLWYVLSPLLRPIMQVAWRYTAFPTVKNFLAGFNAPKTEVDVEETEGEAAMRQAAEDFGLPGGRPIGMSPAGSVAEAEETRQDASAPSKSQLFWQLFFALPRILLMVLTFLAVVQISYGEYAHDHGIFAAALQMLSLHDPIDWLVVMASIVLIVWLLPHLFLAVIVGGVLLFHPKRTAAELGIHTERLPDEALARPAARSEMSSVFQGEHGGLSAPVDTSGRTWLALARAGILRRKAFLLVASIIILLTGLVLFRNSEQFNPNIRPIMAVLRSNFWLTVHVFAIIVGYAAAFIAWGMAVVALGGVLFGRFQTTFLPDGRQRIRLPAFSELFAPIIKRMMQVALVLLVLGTILGARWADYSWGRFWGWDPKEVWALITILFFAIVLHGRIARLYGKMGLMIGGLLGSLAVICTWYVVSFKFQSIHAYGGGEESIRATLILWGFVILNVGWGTLALLRYVTCVYDKEVEA